MKVQDETGRITDTKNLRFADKIIEMKRTRDPWEVIDMLVQHWIDSNPKQYKSFVVNVEDKRYTRVNKFGSNKSKTIRSVADIPEKIIYMIRAIYKSDELEMDKDFFNKFWKRYPIFRVAESL